MDGQRQRRWRLVNREKIREQERQRRQINREKERERKRRWIKANPDKVRAQYERRLNKARSRHTGLTRVERIDLLEKQSNACAICRTTEPGSRGWNGDHDHKTRIVRGILCYRCNLALGLMKDDSARLRSAADYLDRHQQLQSLL